ncbi:sensor histidine kinase [Algoriphagus confluentis]|uniref:histidine kinase n=1 Tax=Algoriphagus confluentis TaxID=1697556 RepID=A0ABQ6PP99_9BACT|nr:histidine kinase N-terminal 7TM domain-containing protein [Algoriphagus confluentis]
MEFLTNPFASFLLFFGLAGGILSIVLFIRLQNSIKWMALTLFAFSFWGFFYGVELASKSVEEMLIWSKVQYLGLLAAPTFWLIFSLKYTDFDPKKLQWIVPAVFVVPALTYFIVLTNSIHHWHYKSNWLIQSEDYYFLGIEKGPWYYFQTAYAYLTYLLGTVLLWKRYRFANKRFKLQTKILIAGGVIPIFANIFYQTSLFKPYEGLDLTPFAFLTCYLILGYFIARFNLLGVQPIARDRILELVTRGLIVFDYNHRIVDFNSAAKKLCTRPEDFKLGAKANLLFRDRPEILTLIDELEPKSIESSLEIEGNKLILKIESVPLKNKNQVYSGTLLLFEDITESIQTKEKLQLQARELQQLNDLKDKFFGIISHDLKGPIFGVKELIHLTQNGLISEKEFIEMLPEISKNMEHVAILLENLLAWTSSQLRGEYLEPQTLNISTLIRNQTNLLSRIAKEKKIRLHLELEEEALVVADKNMMELILRNLISNAIKFSDAESVVKISTQVEENWATVCVQDYGVGISKENLEKLNSGVSFTTRGQNNESGTGLGMILVKEYIMKNKGELKIQSQKGQGSKFCFSLPLAEIPHSQD